MIALDTNILVYAHRQDTPFHHEAAQSLRSIAESPANWAIPWPCLHEFFTVVTRPRVFDPPSTREQALRQVDNWMESPSLLMLCETETHWQIVRELIASAKVLGSQIHDARIAALCIEHGVRELWTADRDFGRFTELQTRNPLVG